MASSSTVSTSTSVQDSIPYGTPPKYMISKLDALGKALEKTKQTKNVGQNALKVLTSYSNGFRDSLRKFWKEKREEFEDKFWVTQGREDRMKVVSEGKTAVFCTFQYLKTHGLINNNESSAASEQELEEYFSSHCPEATENGVLALADDVDAVPGLLNTWANNWRTQIEMESKLLGSKLQYQDLLIFKFNRAFYIGVFVHGLLQAFGKWKYPGMDLKDVATVLETVEQEVERRKKILGEATEKIEVPIRKCILCNKNEKLQQCSRCKSVNYCSREHQLSHWPQHKQFCPLFCKALKEGYVLQPIETPDENAPSPVPGCKVTAKYMGVLTNGVVFDKNTIEFVVGAGRVIRGWDEGFLKMKKGQRAHLICSPEYGYGARGYPPVIPASSILHFTVELENIEYVE